MESLLHEIAHYVALFIEAIAIAVITIGAVEALIGVVRVLVHSETPNDDRRVIWLNFARWLVAGLTFQLAADVVNTSFSPTWDELGHLAAIAAIRTFLSFFLDREVEETRNRQHRGTGEAAPTTSDAARDRAA
jgi:uncharacterized membrane protein